VTEAVAHGGGWGHGIGMCQVGAMGRARHGQDYRQILTTYYTGTDIVRLYR
jgi:stage II sporulation protein D